MRQLAIAVLALCMATAASAQDYMHQPKAGGTLFGQKPPAQKASPGFAGSTASTPYQPYQPPAYQPHATPKPPASPGDTDGGEGFKPFKGSSVYSDRGGLDPYKKPAKPKSIYDR
jgi:hypothetical protein